MESLVLLFTIDYCLLIDIMLVLSINYTQERSIFLYTLDNRIK